MNSRCLFALISLTLLCIADEAVADPCTGPLPRSGAIFEGTARYIVDGDGLCVGQNSNSSTWVEVRLADFYAPELREPGGEKARSALEQIVTGKQIRCEARNRSYDRVVARCTVNGRNIADLMREKGIAEGGRAFRSR